MKKVIIIGAGPGGYYSAINLAKSGYKVSLIEKENIGGTCLNVGCIPTKSLLDQTSLFEHFQTLSAKSIKQKLFLGDNIQINIDALKLFQIEVINQLKQGLEKLFKAKNIELIYGKAQFLSGNKLQIAHSNDTKHSELEADEIIIATGSMPRTIPGFTFDGRLIVSSDNIWNIPYVPKRLLVIGSGPIGIEFARVFKVLGSTVTVSEIKESLCPILDLELSDNLSRSLKRRGIELKINRATKFLEKLQDTVKVEFLSTVDSEREIREYDQVLVAVGRKPNIENLSIEKAEIELEPTGFIKTDEYLKTNKPNIWAIGDVTNYPQLAHTASSQARVVSQNITGKKIKFDDRFIPSCIFGYPEVAFVGFTEEQIKERNIDYKTGKSLYLASGKAKASGLTEGIVKIIMEINTRKILGAHIIGAEASSLIHEIVIAMQNNLTVDQMTNSIHAHPTYSEILLEALEDCLGEAIHL